MDLFSNSTVADLYGPVLEWLLGEGRLVRDTSRFVDALAEKVNQAGVPLLRMSVHTRTLHPLLLASIYLWRRGRPGTRIDREHGIENSPAYLDSPIRFVYEGGGGLRRRLEGAEAQLDFPVLKEIQAEGATDYVVMPMQFSTGRTAAITFATDRPGGFTTTELTGLYDLLPVMAIVFEIQARGRVTRTLLDTYLGPITGERVLSGSIKRGDAQRIHAVLWYSDLRGFTRMSEKLPQDEVVATLNAFFEAQGLAVSERGGEILKFIGDGMLAIFAVAGPEQAAAVVATALDAALDAGRRVDILNIKRRELGKNILRFGIALHVDDVIYGNIGTPDRLDFTVIGAAVNRTARIETLTAELGQRILVSREFAVHCGNRMVSLGAYPLRGVPEPQEIFGLADPKVDPEP
jgi:adenylate cyclase